MIYRIKLSRFVAGLMESGGRLQCDGTGKLDGVPGKPAPGIPAGSYSVGVAGQYIVLYSK